MNQASTFILSRRCLWLSVTLENTVFNRNPKEHREDGGPRAHSKTHKEGQQSLCEVLGCVKTESAILGSQAIQPGIKRSIWVLCLLYCVNYDGLIFHIIMHNSVNQAFTRFLTQLIFVPWADCKAKRRLSMAKNCISANRAFKYLLFLPAQHPWRNGIQFFFGKFPVGACLPLHVVLPGMSQVGSYTRKATTKLC